MEGSKGSGSLNIIEITTIDSPRETIVYNLTCNRMHARIASTRQEDFYYFLVNNPLLIDYVIIGLNQPYRNTLYALYPGAKICIRPHSIQDVFGEVLGIDDQFYEEVAVTGAGVCNDIFIMTHKFIHDFYKQTNKQNALDLYREWVSEMPLGIPWLYRLIRIMEFYMEEILMYFELKDIEDTSLKINR